MKLTSRKIDINAHIEDLSWMINVQNDATIAFVSFVNPCCQTITAIKFLATGFDAFGAPIHINGNSTFFLSFQHIHIPMNGVAHNLRFLLPDKNISSIELEEFQIKYENDDLISYEGKNIIEVSIPEFEPEDRPISALRATIHRDIKFLPKMLEKGWICSCGRYNPLSNHVCSSCGLFITDVMKLNNPEYIDSLVAAYDERVEEKRKKEIEESQIEINKRRETKKNLFLLLFGILVIVLLGIHDIKHPNQPITNYLFDRGNNETTLNKITNSKKYDPIIFEKDGIPLFQIDIDSFYHDLSNITCIGTIKNISDEPFRDISITAKFKDPDGEIIRTVQINLEDDELLSGESASFQISTPHSFSIWSISFGVSYSKETID